MPRRVLASRIANGCGWVTIPGLMIACQARVEVGHSRDPVMCADCEIDAETTAAEPVVPPVPVPPTPPTIVPPALPEPVPEDCDEHEYPAQDTYDAWQTAPNDLGELSGATFVGYIEGGASLTLTIGSDESAVLVVDEPAQPPVADEGYLCDQAILDALDCDLTGVVSGGTYPLHGATLTGGRLQAPIPVAAAFDDWCALQTPNYWGDGCYYSVESSAGYSFSDGYCTVDDQEVDCAWMLLTQAHLCECTSTACFAANSLEAAGLDLRLSDDGTELTGGLLSYDVYFERKP